MRHAARRPMLVILTILMSAATDVAGADLDTFGRCLRSEGATFYGAVWCPHCQAQRQILGSAMRYVRYVECSGDGERGETTPACRRAGVDSFPTWTFGDGSRANGKQSLQELAAMTGCELPDAPQRTPPRKGARPEHGALIIEVPQER